MTITERVMTGGAMPYQHVTAADSTKTHSKEPKMQITPINPFAWHEADDQGLVVDAPGRFVFVSGQTAMSDDGHPQHPDDMRAQVALTLDNVLAVLDAAGVSPAGIVQMNTHVTDVDRFMAEGADLMAERLAAFGIRPPGVLSEVTRLGLLELLVEIDAIAVA